ncbi:polar amino acid ABC transporter, inner membrane subunit [Methylobacterium sp. 4-46]|uniref:amino acid ABC transporter permease n=1 Tax=unclassified Methylobacterium TaxID=2615210 RepID=UPI000152C2D3|nr:MULTISPECIES: amino acid ABC transporter permease [Methylobacterium]ACA16201.1 polar amino acid ABC transporter, inner membrane subunit [Methylobacterium sp. 4-46]WFT81909.1 amino acid ABC transporter permease [Methylobacterium nodulans]
MRYRFDFEALAEYWPDFLMGALTTLEMTAVATVLGLLIGILCAVGRRSPRAWLSRLCGGYVETVRNTPYLIQVFFLYFGLASAGLRLPVLTAAILTLVVNVGAYTGEIVRAGMDTIPPGQVEAAEALGLTRAQIYRDIILRPALERVYPALTSQFVLMMLASSVTSQISAEELTAVANNITSITFRSFETYLVVAVLYLLLALLLKLAFHALAQILFPRRRRLGTAL